MDIKKKCTKKDQHTNDINRFNCIRFPIRNITKPETAYRRPGHLTRGTPISALKECDSTTECCSFRLFKANKQVQLFAGYNQVYEHKHDLQALLEAGEFFWLDVKGFDSQDLVLLSDVFDIHPLILEDIQEHQTQDKLECFEDYFSVTLQSLTSTECEFSSKNVTITVIVYRTHVLTLHKCDCGTLKQAEQAMLGHAAHLRPDWVLYLITDFTTRLLEPAVKRIEKEIDAIDELVYSVGVPEKVILQRMHFATKVLSQLVRQLRSRHAVASALAGSGRNPMGDEIQSSTKLYVHDTLDRVKRYLSSIETCRTFLRGTQSTYYAQLKLSITQSQEATAKAINWLGMTTFIHMPLTLIVVIMGENILVPANKFKTVQPGLEPFIWICLLLLGLTGLMIVWGRRNQLF